MKQEWRGKKVLILGLGQYPQGSGIAGAVFALRQGAEVLVTDQKTEKELKENVRRLRRFPRVRFRFGAHDLKDIEWADIVLRHQRVRVSSPELRLARRLGKQIESAESLFLKRCPCPVVGITGTRGKSTTTTLVAHMLKTAGKRVWLGGNILISPLTFLHRIHAQDLVVLELSSFQLETTGEAGISPRIACITNLMRDHLNAYVDMDEYAEAKAQIFRFQLPDDVLIANGDDATCRRMLSEAPGRTLAFTSKKKLKSAAWIERGELHVREGTHIIRLLSVQEMRLQGEHNVKNALAASLTARALGASISAIRHTLKTFAGLPHRQEVVAIKRGVMYVNDTTATTPDGTIAALRAFQGRAKQIHLILGGSDKELEFDELARQLHQYRVQILLLPGSAHSKLTVSLRRAHVEYRDVPDLRTAVRFARASAEDGDVVLLSPGCASFGQFANEFERGNLFRAFVRTR